MAASDTAPTERGMGGTSGGGVEVDADVVVDRDEARGY